jgi:trk system potassium uptake protein TrkA
MQALGNDVMIVDRNAEKVNRYAEQFTVAHIGDCTNEAVIRSLGVKQMDICFVSIGEDFESSLIITLLLKRAGAKCVIAKANQEIQEDLLRQIGADEVVYPERDLAEKLGSKPL